MLKVVTEYANDRVDLNSFDILVGLNNFDLIIGGAIVGVSDTVVICVEHLAGTESINWAVHVWIWIMSNDESLDSDEIMYKYIDYDTLTIMSFILDDSYHTYSLVIME